VHAVHACSPCARLGPQPGAPLGRARRATHEDAVHAGPARSTAQAANADATCSNTAAAAAAAAVFFCVRARVQSGVQLRCEEGLEAP